MIDFKYGQGVAVEVQENTQGICYAIGAATAKHNRGVGEVEIVIVQPRAYHPDGPIRSWVTDSVTLLERAAELGAAARATEQPDAPLKAGEWCKFCPAAGTCKTREDYALELAAAAFTNDGSVIMDNPQKYDPERLSRMLHNVSLVEDWCRAVREFAHHEAEAGRMPPGWKLVPTQPRRYWISDESETAASLLMADLAPEEIYKKKLKSPAEVEKIFGKKNVPEDVAALWEKKSKGTVLAPADDKRPAVKPEIEGVFDAVDDPLAIPTFLKREKKPA